MAALTSRTRRGSLLHVFVVTFVVYAYFMPRWADWNIDSRLDLVHAIVDGHTLRIDRYHQNTWDKAVYRGHYYSDKAPGTAILGVPVYAAFVAAHGLPILNGGISLVERNRAWNLAIALGKTGTQAAPAPKGQVLGGCQRSGSGNVQYIPWGNRLVPPMQDWALSKYVVTVGVDGLISAAFAAFFFWFLGFFLASSLLRWLLTGLYALASVALPYSTNFYSHQLAAAFLFAAFGLLYLRSRSAIGSGAVPVAGFLLGFALFTEYTVALIVALIGLYALWTLRHTRRNVLLLLGAGTLPVLGILAYNFACFGNPLDTGYSHDFCWSPAQAGGFQGFTYPHLGPLYDLTFGDYRGLFYMSPFLLLAVPGAWLMRRRGLSVEAALCLAVGALFILLISAYWGWNGGKVDGPRYLVPAVPFLAFPVIFYLAAVPRSAAGCTVTAAAGLWSVFASWTEFLGGYLFPISWERDPIFTYSLPMLRSNQIAPNAGMFLGLSGWHSLLPLLLLLLLVGAGPLLGGLRPAALHGVAARRRVEPAALGD